MSLPAQHYDACDNDDQADGQPQRSQHPQPRPGDNPRQPQPNEQQRKTLKKVRAVDSDVLVLHVVPPNQLVGLFFMQEEKSTGMPAAVERRKDRSGLEESPTVVRMRNAPQRGVLSEMVSRPAVFQAGLLIMA